MAIMKNILLWSSTNAFLRERIPRTAFAKRAVRKFMPGETVEAALAEAANLKVSGTATVLTYLGENIKDLGEAERNRDHYLDLYQRLRSGDLPTEVSVKLTQMGLDLSPDRAFAHVRELVVKAHDVGNFLWIDIESSPYVDATLDIYRRLRMEFSNVGICLQSYLYRTEADLASLMPLSPSIRLVKGAYKEPASVAFPRKSDVDRNFIRLTEIMLRTPSDQIGRIGIATHDPKIIEQTNRFALEENIPNEKYEFQLLYGIKRDLQQKLVQEGYRLRVLISYGSAWYAWYLRRLAERPSNAWFVVRSLFR